jgi:hypothetical protein
MKHWQTRHYLLAAIALVGAVGVAIAMRHSSELLLATVFVGYIAVVASAAAIMERLSAPRTRGASRRPAPTT